MALVHLDPQVGKRVYQLDVRADAGAPRREIVAHLLVDLDVPALVVQQVGGEEAAEGAADDEGARHRAEV